MGIKAQYEQIKARARELYRDERELTLDVLNMADNSDTAFYIIYGVFQTETGAYYNEIEYYGETFKGTPGAAEGYTGEIYKLSCMGWIHLEAQGEIGEEYGNKYRIYLTSDGYDAREEIIAKHERDAVAYPAVR